MEKKNENERQILVFSPGKGASYTEICEWY